MLFQLHFGLNLLHVIHFLPLVCSELSHAYLNMIDVFSPVKTSHIGKEGSRGFSMNPLNAAYVKAPRVIS